MTYIQQVQNFFAESGRVPSMFIQTFGCQMNNRESEKFHGLLLAMGFSVSGSEEEADLVLYNTCCVREAAEDKVFGKLGYLKTSKKARPGKIIVFCGCMPQRPEVMERINRHHRHIDVIFGTFNKHHLPRLLLEHLVTGKQVVEILEDHIESEEDEFAEATTRFFPHKAGVSIMHGCNNFCSYCIVPYVRGRETSRRPEDVLAEIEALADDGVKEVMLLGQNVNSYAYGFPDLIRKVNEVNGLKRIRFMTSHPKDLSQDLIDAICESKKAVKHIHLPMQSGSSRILEGMNRGYTKEEYLALVSRLREAIPNITITTDIIVAFPGETEEDFDHTLDAVRQAKFAGAFTFLYSHREGTPAAKLKDLVPKEVASDRFNRLVDLINPLQLEHNQRFLHQTVEVMVEKAGTGRTADNVLVHFEGDATPGDLIFVKITECKTFYLKGECDIIPDMF